MDFEEFLQNPSSYIHKLAQVETGEYDLGMKKLIDQNFRENPEQFYHIPIVSTLEEFHKTAPGTIVRLRCNIIEGPDREMFPYQFLCNGEFFSCLLDQTIPEGAGDLNPRTLGERYCYTGISIRPMTDWFNETITQQNQKLRTGQTASTYSEQNKKKEEHEKDSIPFKIKLKTTYNLKNKSNLEMIDFIGCFVEEEEIDPSEFNGFDASLPTFIAFSYIPPAYFVPNTFGIDINKETMREMRNNVLQILSSIFDEFQAKIFLLWLITKPTHFVGQIQMGGFNLNFHGVSGQEIEYVNGLMNAICPLYQFLEITPAVLNEKELKPIISEKDDESANISPLFCSSGTRYFFYEPKLIANELNETGVKNIEVLQSLVDLNQITIDIYGADYTFNLFNTIFSLSEEKSIFAFDLSIPIESISTPEITEEQINLIRFYVDQQRSFIFDASKTNEELFKNRLVTFQKEHGSLSQERMQLLFLFMMNTAKSIGEEEISLEICKEAEELFALLP